VFKGPIKLLIALWGLSAGVHANPNAGLHLNRAQNAFPSIYLPSVGYKNNQTEHTIPEDAQAPKLKVKGVRFEGNKTLSEADLQAAFKDVVDSDLSALQIYSLTNRIKALYNAQDIAASARVPPQDVDDGIVLFTINESSFNGVEIDYGFEESFNVSLEHLERTAAFGIANNPPLKISQQERAHLLAIDLHGVSASGGLYPDDQGNQTLELWVENTPRLESDIELNNQGPQRTGKTELSINTLYSSPLGRGGAAYVSAIKSEGVEYISLAYRGPTGAYGGTLDLQAGVLGYQTDSSQNPPYKGEASSLSLGYRYPLIRSLSANVFATGLFEQRQLSDTRLIANQSVKTADYQVNSFDVRIDGNSALATGRLTYSGELVAGNVDLGGSPNRADDRAGARSAGDFVLAAGTAQYAKSVDENWRLVTKAKAQIANKNLDSSVQLLAGGNAGLRAYSADELSVDQGILMSLDLTRRINDALTLGLFYDAANLMARHNNSDINGNSLVIKNRFNLSNLGLSAAYRFENNARLNVTLAHALATTPGSASQLTQSGNSRLLARLVVPF